LDSDSVAKVTKDQLKENLQNDLKKFTGKN